VIPVLSCIACKTANNYKINQKEGHVATKPLKVEEGYNYRRRKQEQNPYGLY
jgi:hypothetical protein